MVFAFLQPVTARNVLLILLGVGYLGYHVLHRWRRRPKAEEKKSKREVEERNLTSAAAEPLTSGEDAASPLSDQHGRARTPAAPQGGSGVSALPGKIGESPSSSLTSGLDHSPPDDATGEALFDRARALPHQEIPDFEIDAEYLDLLGKSAAAGYAPALAKLGEYAMRRAAWVEAYYWMSMAKRRGMLGLSNVMREIRKNWSLDGFPDEAENVNQLFTLEAGSIGRALLHVDSGHKAAKAKEFLRANHPEFRT